MMPLLAMACALTQAPDLTVVRCGEDVVTVPARFYALAEGGEGRVELAARGDGLFFQWFVGGEQRPCPTEPAPACAVDLPIGHHPVRLVVSRPDSQGRREVLARVDAEAWVAAPVAGLEATATPAECVPEWEDFGCQVHLQARWAGAAEIQWSVGGSWLPGADRVIDLPPGRYEARALARFPGGFALRSLPVHVRRGRVELALPVGAIRDEVARRIEANTAFAVRFVGPEKCADGALDIDATIRVCTRLGDTVRVDVFAPGGVVVRAEEGHVAPDAVAGFVYAAVAAALPGARDPLPAPNAAARADPRGRLVVVPPAGAPRVDVALNGVPLGAAPLDLALPAGSFDLAFTAPGHRPLVRRITVDARRDTVVDADPPPLETALALRCDGPATRVRVDDGELFAPAASPRPFAAGRHDVFFFRGDGAVQHRAVELGVGQVVEVACDEAAWAPRRVWVRSTVPAEVTICLDGQTLPCVHRMALPRAETLGLTALPVLPSGDHLLWFPGSHRFAAKTFRFRVPEALVVEIALEAAPIAPTVEVTERSPAGPASTPREWAIAGLVVGAGACATFGSVEASRAEAAAAEHRALVRHAGRGDPAAAGRFETASDRAVFLYGCAATLAVVGAFTLFTTP